MWNRADLEIIDQEDGIRIAPFREDGRTPGTPTYIWAVRVGDALYVRPYSGARSSWYRAAIKQGAGEIVLNGRVFGVRFEAADPAVLDAVDAAYRAKYHASQYLPPMIAGGPRNATVKVLPRTE
ncbi:DUF2255 family protein [Komagataeibacter sp. FNDCF1]|uniref:DUF2255 family protein n=1 Tax=Komagataeibacter sp. FNDCF1 TaxID=2878681 RepID=UPI001E6042A3|nr:DUF2255 family protein [Komagataeibacter sp. FNDCF1]MCE2564808.1 DUF2255 family protein [Komagataeibacter sp. FNDCF1]